LLFEFRRYAESLAAHKKALAINTELAEAWFGCGKALFAFGRSEEALGAFDKAAALGPDLAYLNCARLWTRMLLADWSGWAAECERLISIIRDGVPAAPFVSLTIPATSADHLQCARIHTEGLYAGSPALWCGEWYSHDRIRIGYLSADFRKGHPVAYLTAGLFALHDRSRFETTALSFGPADDSEFGQRLKGSFERFVDVRDQADAQIADLVRKLEIDVAIDLTGFLDGARPGILARRPAPIQVSYMGFPGTMGAGFIDYLIADAVAVPFEEQPFYTERIVHLPETYWVTDMARRMVGTTPCRSDAGLPENGFVFCCFNNAPKINQTVFEVWMRLLANVPGSVLWLLRDNADAERNLRREAQARGVDPARLVFAGRVALEDHLARHRLADLFLDTLPYNAHTTASDALWTGLPVLTCLGSTFAGRVAASQLLAVGLPELITRSRDEYEALALKLAKDPVLLSSLKAKLEKNRLTHPLFDTERSVRHIEAAYTKMWEIWQRGESPRSFRIDCIET
jgi:predicted O-linked N-acetylglucosamine transferase (SPINDLY family)